MDHRANPENLPGPDFLDDVTGALDWWRDAGVDCDFADEPTSWLAEPGDDSAARPHQAPARPAPAATEEAPRALDTRTLPPDLASFTAWWLSEPLLAEGALSHRVPPRGAAGAALMILVEEPEAQDTERLLTGEQGRLLDAMLRAFGLDAAQTYVASALPRCTPGADWADAAARGLGLALTHHIGLVAPERLIVLGSNVLSLLGHEPPQQPAVLRSFNHEGRVIPMLASWPLPALLRRPRAKAMVWRAWLEWTGG